MALRFNNLIVTSYDFHLSDVSVVVPVPCFSCISSLNFEILELSVLLSIFLKRNSKGPLQLLL